MWLDKKKSKEQLKPARAIHKTAECIEDLEHQRADGYAVHKDLAKRTVSVGACRAFWHGDGRIHATVWASLRYTPEELEMALAYGNSE